MTALGLRGTFQVKDYMTGLRNYPAMKVFNLISDIRTTEARSKGVDNSSASDADLLKELLYKILHKHKMYLTIEKLYVSLKI